MSGSIITFGPTNQPTDGQFEAEAQLKLRIGEPYIKKNGLHNFLYIVIMFHS